MQIPPHIFISPHRDDACFSLGATISLLGGGHLINIFTESSYTAHPSLSTNTPPLGNDIVTAIRNREEGQFCATANLTRHELGFADTTLRDISWSVNDDQNSLKEPTQQAKLIMVPLGSLLQELTNNNAGKVFTIYCPMAIGNHRDHLSTFLAMLMIRYQSRLPSLQWFYYEDLPYASWLGERERGIARFKEMMGNKNWNKSYIPLRPDQITRKMELVNIYSSQHHREPISKDFFCSDSWRLGPHESLWTQSS